MKNLYVKDIISQLGIKMDDSQKNFHIKKVVTNPKHVSNNTLLILLKKRKRIGWNKLFSTHSVAVLTSSRVKAPSNITVFRVPNVKNVYWKFVRLYRGLFDIPVIGVTGTCGKTTTKEMIAWILKGDWNVQKTKRNLNDPARSFKYLLGINEYTQAAVFEMPVSRTGSLRYCCNVFQPQIGIITTIGVDHLDRCRTIQNYIKEKQSLIEGMKYRGILILNADDENIQNMNLDNFLGKIIYFGCGENADFRAKDIVQLENEIQFTLQFQSEEFLFLIPGHGKHTVYNALAAIAASHIVGFPLEKAQKRLKTFSHPQFRMQMLNGINGSTIFDDTYSMNVTSVVTALDVIKNYPSNKRKIAVLGNLLRMGTAQKEMHQLIGKIVAEADIDLLYTIGDKAEEIARQAVLFGMKKEHVFPCHNALEVYEHISLILDSDTMILVKAPSDYYDLIERIKQTN